MDEEELYLIMLNLLLKRKKRRRQNKNIKKRKWVRDIFLKRDNLSEYSNLVQELRLGDHQFYFR